MWLSISQVHTGCLPRSTKVWRHQTQPKRGICTQDCCHQNERRATPKRLGGIKQEEVKKSLYRLAGRTGSLWCCKSELQSCIFWCPGDKDSYWACQKNQDADLRVCTGQSHAHIYNWITLWPSNCQTLPETHGLLWWTRSFLQMVSETRIQGVRSYWEHRDQLWKRACSYWGTFVALQRIFSPFKKCQANSWALKPCWHFSHWLLMLINFNLAEYTDFAILTFQFSLCHFFFQEVY